MHALGHEVLYTNRIYCNKWEIIHLLPIKRKGLIEVGRFEIAWNNQTGRPAYILINCDIRKSLPQCN
jgi:hypothetical protein